MESWAGRFLEIIQTRHFTAENVDLISHCLCYFESFKKDLAAVPKTVRKLIFSCFSVAKYAPGETVCKEGELLDKVVLLVAGTLSVKHTHALRGSVAMPGTTLGVLLPFKTPAQVSAVARTPCTCVTLAVQDYKACLQDDAWEAFEKKLKMMRDCFPVLEKYPLTTKEKIAEAIQLAEYPKGTCLVKAGEPQDLLYVVTQGELAVGISTVYGKHSIARLGPGTVIGEESCLLTKAPGYTVKVASDWASVYFLKKHDLALVPEETKEQWRLNFFLKQRSRDKLRTATETRLELGSPLAKQPRRFTLANPVAKARLSQVLARNLSKDCQEAAKQQAIIEKLKECHPGRVNQTTRKVLRLR